MGWTNPDQNTSALLVFTGTFALTYLIWNQFLNGRRKIDKGKLPPSIGSWPFVGSLPYVPKVEVFHKFFLEKAYEVGDVISFETPHNYIVLLNSFESIQEAFVKQSTASADRPLYYIYEFLNPTYKGIIDSGYHASFKKYHQLSLAILREFGFGQRMIETRISLEVDELINNLKELKENPVDPQHLVASSVLSVISSIAVGDRMKSGDTVTRVAAAVDDVFKYTREALLIDHIHSFRYLPKYKTLLQKVVAAQTIVLDTLRTRIDGYLSAQSTGQILDECFISSFITREGPSADYDQLLYTLRDLFYAGFETSSTTIVWLLLMIANHPQVQDRLHKELDAVVPRDRTPSLDDKSQLLYLEAVVLETMRIKTLLPTGLPRQTLNDLNVQQYIIPKGSTVLPNLYAAHMDKRFWKDPETFSPERFLDSTGTKIINKERVIPFSVGKRSCLGELLARQEIYLFTAGLLQQFHIRPPEGLDQVHVEDVVQITLHPSPFKLRFLHRT